MRTLGMQGGPPPWPRDRWRRPLLAILVLCAGLAQASPADDDALVDAFWRCDYVANTYGIDEVDGPACARIYELVKARRFHGDFNAMLAWWTAHKEAEYERLRTGARR